MTVTRDDGPTALARDVLQTAHRTGHRNGRSASGSTRRTLGRLSRLVLSTTPKARGGIAALNGRGVREYGEANEGCSLRAAQLDLAHPTRRKTRSRALGAALALHQRATKVSAQPSTSARRRERSPPTPTPCTHSARRCPLGSTSPKVGHALTGWRQHKPNAHMAWAQPSVRAHRNPGTSQTREESLACSRSRRRIAARALTAHVDTLHAFRAPLSPWLNQSQGGSRSHRPAAAQSSTMFPALRAHDSTNPDRPNSA
jgi:hypothetical protein